jgi:plasmid maintenance system antidote protein VapI
MATATEAKKVTKLPIPPPRLVKPFKPALGVLGTLKFKAVTSLSEAIREKLETLGWTERELAQVLGVKPSIVAQLLDESTAELLAPEMAHRLAAAFEDSSALDWMITSARYHLAITDPARRPRLSSNPVTDRKALARARAKPKTKKAATPKATAKNAPTATRKPQKAQQKQTAADTRRDIIVRLLSRADGCTSYDVRDAIGWTAVSIPQQCKQLGIAFRKKKSPGQQTRYFSR